MTTTYTGVKMTCEASYDMWGAPTNYLHGSPYDGIAVKELRERGWLELQPNHLSQKSFGRRAWYRKDPGHPHMIELLSYETLVAVANTDLGIGWIVWDGVNTEDGYGGGTWGDKPSATTRKHIKEFFLQFAPANGIVISWNPKSRDYPSKSNMIDRLIERTKCEIAEL